MKIDARQTETEVQTLRSVSSSGNDTLGLYQASATDCAIVIAGNARVSSCIDRGCGSIAREKFTAAILRLPSSIVFEKCGCTCLCGVSNENRIRFSDLGSFRSPTSSVVHLLPHRILIVRQSGRDKTILYLSRVTGEKYSSQRDPHSASSSHLSLNASSSTKETPPLPISI